MVEQVCKVDDCEVNRYVRGYCHRHYSQIMTKGRIVSEEELAESRSASSRRNYHTNPNVRRGIEMGWKVGIPRTDEVKEKISNATKGKKKNVVYSEERRKKIGDMSRGKKFTKEHKENISKGLIGKRYPERMGEKHHNWKGGATQRQRSSADYVAWRLAVFTRDDYTCQVCLIEGGHLHADHIVAWADCEELRLEVSNGRTLCRSCHYYVTFKRQMPSGSKWGITKTSKFNKV